MENWLKNLIRKIRQQDLVDNLLFEIDQTLKTYELLKEQNDKQTQELNDIIKSYLVEIDARKKSAEYLEVDNKQLKLAIEKAELTIVNLTAQIKNLNEESNRALYDYWYNKYPKTHIHLHYGYSVREFARTNNDKVPKLVGNNYDGIMNKTLKHVIKFMTYVADEKENWQTANETMIRKKGDCEEGAILMYAIAVKSGVPKERLRINAGDVTYKGGRSGHCYLSYLRESDNEWYVMDWCYWPKESIDFKKSWDDAKNYFGIWYSFNQDYVWLKPDYKGEF